MIVNWSETYLRTSLTNALSTIHSSPPNITSYLIEPPPVIECTVHVPPASSTIRSSSIINKTNHERETTVVASSSNASWQNNLPDVCIY